MLASVVKFGSRSDASRNAFRPARGLKCYRSARCYCSSCPIQLHRRISAYNLHCIDSFDLNWRLVYSELCLLTFSIPANFSAWERAGFLSYDSINCFLRHIAFGYSFSSTIVAWTYPASRCFASDSTVCALLYLINSNSAAAHLANIERFLS